MQDSAGSFLYSLIMITFSQQLLKEAQNHFSTLYNREISKEEAENFLSSLSQLIDIFLD